MKLAFVLKAKIPQGRRHAKKLTAVEHLSRGISAKREFFVVNQLS